MPTLRCFVASPLSESKSKVRRQANFVLDKIIKPSLRGTEYRAKRVDRDPKPEGIVKQILNDIMKCDLLIADLTGHNPNVMYELAFAHTIGKPTINIIESKKKLPFDVKDKRAIRYEYKNATKVRTKNTIYKIQSLINAFKKNPLKIDSPVFDNVKVSGVIKLLLGFLNDDENLSLALDRLGSFIHPNGNITLLETEEPNLHKIHDSICEIAYGTRRLRITDKFRIYCDECTRMIARSSADDEIGIITVQTPVKVQADQQYRTAFNKYINETIKQISDNRIRYTRIIIVDSDSNLHYKAVKSFIRKLLRYAKRNNIRCLDHISLGFLSKNRCAKTIFSNVDLHLTSDREFSVAFMASTRYADFGQSMHIYDIDGGLANNLRKDMTKFWREEISNKIQLPARIAWNRVDFEELFRKCDEKIIKHIAISKSEN